MGGFQSFAASSLGGRFRGLQYGPSLSGGEGAPGVERRRRSDRLASRAAMTTAWASEVAGFLLALCRSKLLMEVSMDTVPTRLK